MIGDRRGSWGPWRSSSAAEAVLLAVAALVALACLGWAVSGGTGSATRSECAELWETGRHSSELRDVGRDDFMAECLAR